MPVRRSSLILVAVAAVLSSMFVSPAIARVSVEAAPAATASDSSSGTDALRTVRALFSGALRNGKGLLPEVLPDLLPQLIAETPAYDATMALRELALHKDELSGRDLAEAEGYLARPTDPRGPSNPDASYTVA